MMYRNFFICLFLVFTFGCSDSNNDNGFDLSPVDPPATPIQPASAGQPGWLYAQTAATAQMTSDTVLEIPFTRDVFGFTDRPDREHAYLTAFEFASLWTAEGANSFSADAPNAVLTWQVGEEQREAEVIINNATVYSDGVKESLVYEVTLETEQMPDAQMSSVSLFVDSSASRSALVTYGGTLAIATSSECSGKTGNKWTTPLNFQYDLECACGNFGKNYYESSGNLPLLEAFCEAAGGDNTRYTVGGGKSGEVAMEDGKCYELTYKPTGRSVTLMSVDGRANKPVHMGGTAKAYIMDTPPNPANQISPALADDVNMLVEGPIACPIGLQGFWSTD